MKATLIFGVGILLVLASMTGVAIAHPELPAAATQHRVIELNAEDIVISVESPSTILEMLRGNPAEPVILRIRGAVEIPDFSPPGFIVFGIRGAVEIPDVQPPIIIILGIRGAVEIPDVIIANGIMF